VLNAEGIRGRGGQPSPARPGGRGLRRLRDGPWLFLLPAAIYLGATALYPLYMLVRMALSDVRPINILGTWPYVGLDTFRGVLGSSDFWSALRVTVYFTGALLVLDLGIGFLAALAMRSSRRLGNVALTLMMLVWSLPPIVNGTVWKFMLQGDGLINAALQRVGLPEVVWLGNPGVTLWSLVGVVTWASIPFAATVIRAALLGIPPELLEAAAIDGAGRWGSVRHVVLPLLRPVLLVLALLVVVYAFRSFDFIYVITKGGPGTATTTLPFLAYKQSFQLFNFGTGAATAVAAMAVVIALAAGYLIASGRGEEELR
jgi:ABC-type sugar transport system permease subunit